MAKTFEESLDQLEEIVRKLEADERPLAESLALIEKGVKLSRDCRDSMAKADRRIEGLLKEPDGRIRLE